MFDTSHFMQVFEDNGMALRALRAGAPAGPGFVVGLQRPEQLILGDAVHTAMIEIDYATADAPDLATGEGLTIGRLAHLDTGEAVLVDGVAYRVRDVPRKQGDGSFSKAELEEIRA
jgi:hypothetical protein